METITPESFIRRASARMSLAVSLKCSTPVSFPGYQCSLTKLFLKKRPYALPALGNSVAASSYLSKIKSLRLEGPRGIYANYSNHLSSKEDSQDSNDEDLEDDEETFFEDFPENTNAVSQNHPQSTEQRDHEANCSCSDCKKTLPTELPKTEFKINAESSSDALSCSTSPVQLRSRPGSPWDFSENANSLLNMNNSPAGLNGFLFPNPLPGSSSDQALANIQPTTVTTPRGSQKQFLCPMCNRHFTQKGNLKTHMMIHTGEKPFSCQICGRSFTQKGNVDTHMKIHTGEKDYGCYSCGKRFARKGNLKTHLRSVHSMEKPFACGVCGKCFSQKGNMQTHLRTHNKDDRFPCPLCGKTFSQKGNLKTHIQRHIGQASSRSFQSNNALQDFSSLGMAPPDWCLSLDPRL